MPTDTPAGLAACERVGARRAQGCGGAAEARPRRGGAASSGDRRQREHRPVRRRTARARWERRQASATAMAADRRFVNACAAGRVQAVMQSRMSVLLVDQAGFEGAGDTLLSPRLAVGDGLMRCGRAAPVIDEDLVVGGRRTWPGASSRRKFGRLEVCRARRKARRALRRPSRRSGSLRSGETRSCRAGRREQARVGRPRVARSSTRARCALRRGRFSARRGGGRDYVPWTVLPRSLCRTALPGRSG